MQSVAERERKFDPARDDVILIGDSDTMPIAEALATDFDAAFQEAHQAFASDTDKDNPNDAPKECWPSTQQFRHIRFKAGQHQGPAASKHLDRIPDPDLRLFAQIELCAGMEGLPQIGGVTVGRSPQCTPLSSDEIDQFFGQPLPGIRCPKCNWIPRAKNQWSCKCEQHWNTFDTRGLCPGCGHQWEITGCLQCGVMSPHAEWYVDN